ncbi:MAG: YicC family protein [Synergistaceae bacterium]|jgi:uncharacterized protein (TIGR00255 family)|nr:YicC family protein [Synergistaceae bacterium]
MYVSMTGFCSASLTREWGTISLELSSVNHRYQEIYARLPRELASWEPWFHQKLRGLYRRGKVQARVDIMWDAASLAVSLDRDVLVRYYRELSEARKALGAGGRIRLDALLNLPGVLDTQERVRFTHGEGAEEILTELLGKAARGWNDMRALEGGHLETEINVHLERLEGRIRTIGEMWKKSADAAFEAMKVRLVSALEAANLPALEDSRMAQEAVIIADRWDISEELARMKSHIAKFRKSGASEESVGRKLDFLVQEMNREVNTINSKVADPEIRWEAVEAKTSLERIREQIQNLE